jgi:hypothetical protein
VRRATAAKTRYERLLAGAKNPSGALRGPNGRVLCRWCGTEVAPPRRTFCSGGKVWFVYREGSMTNATLWGCAEEWKIRAQPGFLRRVVWARDRGRCAGCGRACGGRGGAWIAEHTHALFLGGSGSLANVRTLCRDCDRVKTRVDRSVATAVRARGIGVGEEG